MNPINLDHPLITIGQNIPDAICLVDLEFKIQCWNKGAEDIFGYTPEEIIGKHLATIIPAEIAQQEIDHCVTVLNRDGKMAMYESVRLARDGRRIAVELSAVALKTGETVTAYASIMRDITVRKRLEDELAESEANLRTMFNSSDNAIFVHDLDGRVIDVNDKTLEMYGVDPDEALGQSIARDYSSPDNPVDMLPEIWKKVLAGESRLFEWNARRPNDGSIFPAEVYLKRIRFRNKDVIMAVVRDISERKRSEEALKLTQFAMDHASIATFLISPDAHFLYANDQACRVLDYSRQELLSLSVSDVDPNFPASQWDGHWAQLRKEGSLRIESLHRKKDGSVFPVEISINYLGFGDREYNWAFASDISERKQAEQRLKESEEKYRSIVETSTDWIWEMDVQGRITFNNPAVEQMLGYRSEELHGRNAFDLILEEDRAEAAQAVQEAIEQKQGWNKLLLRWKHRDGSIRFIESNAAPIFNERGTLTGFRGSDHDLTGLKIAEEALKKAYSELEIKVQERTRELARTNQQLTMEVAERRRAVDLIRRSKALSDALNDLGTVIHSSLDINEIMPRVLKGAAEAMKADATLIGVFEEGIFRVRYAYNMPPEFTRRTLTSNELRAMDYAARAKDAVAFNDAFNDERLNIQFVRQMGIQSLLVVPVMSKDTAVGGMVFYGLSNRVDFDEERIDFARKLNASVSLALENARLYQSLEESRKLAESHLRELRTIYETAPVGLVFLDRNTRYVSINRRLAEMNGVTIEETMGRTVREVIRDDAAAQTVEDLCRQVIETGMPVENVEIPRKTRKGAALTVLAHYYPVRDQAGAVVGVNIVVQDITARKRTEEALRASERRLKAILNSIPDMAWLKDRECRFILVNQPFGTAAGKKPEELIGKTDFDAWPRELAEKYLIDDREVMRKGIPKRVEETIVFSGGAVRWTETIKTPIYNEKGIVVGTAGIARDVTDRKRMEEESRHMAHHDALTGLPNRRLFIDILKVELAQARRHRTKLAILFLDLDRFKEINDTLGHEAGDNLLKEVADRFRGTIRESDTAARIGGDEFNMILSDIGRIEDVSDIAVKIVDSLRKPIVISGHELQVTTSVGISIYPDDSDDTETLLRYADIAMYHAKESGRNTFRYYNPSINVKTIERMKLERWLRQTIHRGELSVLYQPQIDIKSKKISYAEALVRWNHPQRGLLEPCDFIPLAEETGFITSIDEWMLRTVCSQAAAWKKAGQENFSVAVNLSARQFESPVLVKMISAILAETGLPPGCLDLEVTESTAMSDVEQSASQLRELREMGVHISIDDFGTGYSSLNYLKKLPIDRLKIDQSFIRDIATDSDDRAIINAVTSMAHKMGIKTVGEGVETEEQLAFLSDADCDEAQGFLFSRPVTAEQFRELVSPL